jgi:hypothetical protein
MQKPETTKKAITAGWPVNMYREIPGIDGPSKCANTTDSAATALTVSRPSILFGLGSDRISPSNR